jgi:predicted nucleic acid-binding Zn ribbon protein
LGTGAGLIFKGAGFYATDYRSQSYRQDAKADKQGAGAPSGEASADKKKSGQGDKK